MSGNYCGLPDCLICGPKRANAAKPPTDPGRGFFDKKADPEGKFTDEEEAEGRDLDCLTTQFAFSEYLGDVEMRAAAFSSMCLKFADLYDRLGMKTLAAKVRSCDEAAKKAQAKKGK